MFSRPNDHHQSQRSSSPPPPEATTGLRRRRSPDPTPSGSEDESAQYKKSPHTKRIVKKGRTTSNHEAVDLHLPHLIPAHTPPSQSQNRQPVEEPASRPLTTPSSTKNGGSDHIKHLESLLDSVLAMLVVIQATSTQPVALSHHSREVLSVLNQLAAPPSQTMAQTTGTAPPSAPAISKPTKTYAQMTTSRPAVEKPAHTDRSSQAGQSTSCKNRPKVRLPLPQRHNSSPNRLIITWHGYKIPRIPHSLAGYVSFLEHCLQLELGGRVKRIASANVTRFGRLVIETRNPFTAAQLQKYQSMIHESRTQIPDFEAPDSCLPFINLNVPWHGVVIHDLPGASLRTAMDIPDLAEHIETHLEKENGILGKDIRGPIRALCSEEDLLEKECMSILLRFEDQSICDHLRRNGVFLFGQRCHVSKYQPLKRKPISSWPTSS